MGDLAFLLIYVPGSMLNGNQYAYGTYEQGFLPRPKGVPEAYFGATLIAVNDLLGSTGRWRYPKNKVQQVTPGVFKAGISFWQFLLEVLLCRRSSWLENAVSKSDRSLPPFRTLSIGASEISKEHWKSIQESADQWLPNEYNNRNRT